MDLAPAGIGDRAVRAHGDRCREHLSQRTANMKTAGSCDGQVAMAMVMIVAVGLPACGAASQSAGAGATGGDQRVPAELRDVRYCEVLPSVAQGATVLTSVYNTLGYNDCPAGRWAALTEDEVNRAYGSQA